MEDDIDRQINFLREWSRNNRAGIRKTYSPDANADMCDAIAARLEASRAIPVSEGLPDWASREELAKQIWERVVAAHPEATKVGPVYHFKSPVIGHKYTVIASKNTRHWLIWPFWSMYLDDRVATYSAESLPELLAKLPPPPTTRPGPKE